MKTVFPLISCVSLHLCVSAAELDIVQIVIILLVMTFMIVVIICLLNHYRLPALAFLSRLSHTQRDQATQMVGDSNTTIRWAGIIASLFQWSAHPKKIDTKLKNHSWLDYYALCSQFNPVLVSELLFHIWIIWSMLLYILLQCLNIIFKCYFSSYWWLVSRSQMSALWDALPSSDWQKDRSQPVIMYNDLQSEYSHILLPCLITPK